MLNQGATRIHPTTLTFDSTAEMPAPLGLLGLGMTLLLLGFRKAGIFPVDTMVLGMGIFYGGVAQIIVGVMEWKKNHSFGAAAFTSYGLFWLSYVALDLLPATGFGNLPQTSSMASYLTMWGLYSAILFTGTFKMNRSLQILFGLLAGLLFLHAASDVSGGYFLAVVTGCVGLLAGLSALYAGLGHIVNENCGKTIIPLGTPDKNS